MDEGFIQQICEIAQALHNDRSRQRSKNSGGITKLHNEYFAETTSQFKLHAKLDVLIIQAYGFNPDEALLLEKLLAFNLELAEKEKGQSDRRSLGTTIKYHLHFPKKLLTWTKSFS